MIFFGHIGLTLAAARVFEKSVPAKPAIGKAFSGYTSTTGYHSATVVSPLEKLQGRSLDYRIILIGSILPDLFDKSVIYFLAGESFRSGRALAHTLVFSLVLICLGLLLHIGYKEGRMLQLGLTGVFHLAMDQMWKYPDVLFWPVEKSRILPQKAAEVWTEIYTHVLENSSSEITLSSFNRLFRDPFVYLPEIIGFGILVVFIWSLVRRKKLSAFLRMGKW